MPRRQESPLYNALGSFGRCAGQLDAEHLDSFPQVLVELFGESILTNPSERQRRAEQVTAVLQDIIRSIDDEFDKRVAQAVLASTAEFHDRSVEQRKQDLVHGTPPVTLDDYKTRRPRVVRHVEAALRRAVGTEAISKLDLLSSDARKAARQLYWHLQEALLYIESFDHAARIIENLAADGDYYNKALVVISSRTVHSDAALWAFAHCFEYLRTMQSDVTGRDFLREHLPTLWWRRELNTPFTNYETAEIRAALGEAQVDEATPFVEVMLRGIHGQSAHGRWLQLLSAPPVKDDEEEPSSSSYGKYRSDLLTSLIALVMILERVFPEDTRPPAEVSEASDIVVWNLVLWGPVDLGLSFDDDEGHEVYRAIKAALQDGPGLWTSRHLFSETEQGEQAV